VGNNNQLAPLVENMQAGPSSKNDNNYIEIPTDDNDVWEIDNNLLRMGNKVASGSYGDL
jgi:hypothetical protein